MDFRIIVAAGAILFSGILHAQENIALGKPVGERGRHFGIGLEQPGIPPNIVTDGVFFQDVPPETPPEDPLTWNRIGSWWTDWECSEVPLPGWQPCWLEIDLMGWYTIDSFIFQGGSDAYLIQYWVEEPPHWEVAWRVPAVEPTPECLAANPQPPDCIQTRPNAADNGERWQLAEAIETNSLRIQADYGDSHDGYYAVTELQAFGPDFCTVTGGTNVESGCGQEEPEFESHVAAGEICYRFELSCDGDVSGGFGACVYPNGFFDFHMGGQVGEPHPPEPGEPECGFGGIHMLNSKVEHSCLLDDQGKVQLEVKQVGMVHCDVED